jgi:mRNA interferase YafQ
VSKNHVYQIRLCKRYKKDIKRLAKSNVNLDPLEDIINKLANRKLLPGRCKDHALKGKLQNTRECHIKADWLLRYAKYEDELILILISTGSHRNVLGIE